MRLQGLCVAGGAAACVGVVMCVIAGELFGLAGWLTSGAWIWIAYRLGRRPVEAVTVFLPQDMDERELANRLADAFGSQERH